MTAFPAPVQNLLRGSPQATTHGLNLALPLQHPSQLPLILWDITAAKPVIQSALDQLSFLHFARFVPSWDGSALMVVTEFDGPLEPYVMDFAVAIGDVFDRLLSYVDPDIAPPLPIRNHPDEFLAFVKRWNRVRFLPLSVGDAGAFPDGFDYPIYSAYPERTAIDIAGPLAKRPPALDRPAARVDAADVQGNLLRGYHARHAHWVFLTVTDAAKARGWLSALAGPRAAGTPAWRTVTSGAPWPVPEGGGRPIKPEVTTNVAFTFAGLQALVDTDPEVLATFPAAFREGAQARAKENGDLGEDGTLKAEDLWRFGLDAQHIHVAVVLHGFADPRAGGPDWNRFVAACEDLVADARRHGLARVATHDAQALPEDGVYFGYRDGITDPRISGQAPAMRAGREPDDFQPAASPGEFLLGPDYLDIYHGPSIGKMPPALAHNGTFAALRLIEQDVQAFEAALDRGATATGLDRDLIKAKMMGRWANGHPVSLDHPDPANAPPRNDFDYAPSWEHPEVPQDHVGERCPVGAHIRRSNPRNARVAGQRHSRRLLRRGLPTRWTDDNGAERVGLLGLFLCADLERQFEFIQRQWIQGDLAASGIRGTQDPITGLRTRDTTFRIPIAGREAVEITVPPLVGTRGSLYLFFPGIAGLRALAGEPADAAAGGAGPGGDDPWTLIRRGQAQAADPPAISLGIVDHVKQTLATLGAIFSLATRGLRIDDAWRRSDGVAVGPDGVPLASTGPLRSLLSDLFDKGLQSEWVQTLLASLFQGTQPAPKPDGVALPVTDLDPTAPAVLADPYSALCALRASLGNVVWSAAHGAVWVLDAATARQVLGDPARFVQQPSTARFRGIITLDGDRHRVVRAAVQAGLDAVATPERVARLVDLEAGEALRRIEGLEHFDAVSAYGDPVPGEVFWEILGVPDAQRPSFDALARTMMRHFGQPVNTGRGDAAAFTDASLGLAKRLGLLLGEAVLRSVLFGRGDPDRNPFAGTLIGELARRIDLPLNEEPERTVTPQEGLATLVQLVLAGFMSMQFLMGTATRNLLRPDPRAESRGLVPWRALARLRREGSDDFGPALATALNEARRVDPPVTIVQRWVAAGGAPLGGTHLPADTAVFVVVAAAHRDPVYGPAEDAYHWDRVLSANLALGYGLHECIGRMLQEWVVPRALTRLMEAMPELRLRETGAVPAWLDNLYFRCLLALPVYRR